MHQFCRGNRDFWVCNIFICILGCLISCCCCSCFRNDLAASCAINLCTGRCGIKSTCRRIQKTVNQNRCIGSRLLPGSCAAVSISQRHHSGVGRTTVCTPLVVVIYMHRFACAQNKFCSESDRNLYTRQQSQIL